MKVRTLGRGLSVAEIGFGCMALSGVYGPAERSSAIDLLHQIVEHGVTMLDTADAYGPFHNEELVGEGLRGIRDKVVLATKFGTRKHPDGSRTICGTPDYVREACEGSLKRLGVGHIDLYYQHRVDRTVPIEDTVGAMAELVAEGKVRHLGLSEVSVSNLRRAHQIHPITAVQSELSLWSREDEADILPACRELGIGYVAYSPLGRGFLAASLGSSESLAPGDLRRTLPRFDAANIGHNARLTNGIEAFAASRGMTRAQLALAWVLHLGADIVPIPGTRSEKHLAENLKAADVALTPAEMRALDELAPAGSTKGDRYPAALMGLIDR